MTRGRSRWILGISSVAGIVVLIIALNFQSLMFGSAALISEQRPRLLYDADWGQPNSARQFQARFRPGTPEDELLEWLAQYNFPTDRATRTATHRVEGFPCNELIDVTWHVTNNAIITNAQAVVHEGGCL